MGVASSSGGGGGVETENCLDGRATKTFASYSRSDDDKEQK